MNFDQWCEETVELGNERYTQDELKQIAAQPPNSPNGLVQLARELFATKVALACNSDPSCIKDIVAAADMLIGDLVVPPIGDGFLPPSSVNNFVLALRDYNQGRQCAPICDERE
jgi:hypothetical protein